MSEPTTAEEQASSQEQAQDRPEETGLRFDDPYWDDAFCAWWDPRLRSCC